MTACFCRRSLCFAVKIFIYDSIFLLSVFFPDSEGCTLRLLKTHVMSCRQKRAKKWYQLMDYMIIQNNPWNITFKVARKFYFMHCSHVSLFCSVQVYISLYFLPLQICNFPLYLFYKSSFFVKFKFLNLFSFLSVFSVFINEYIFRWLAYKSF